VPEPPDNSTGCNVVMPILARCLALVGLLSLPCAISAPFGPETA
jgi:hypothetical protein